MSSQDPIKEAFQRAKQDILSLKDQLSLISEDVNLIKVALESLRFQHKDRQTNQQTQIPTQITTNTQENNTNSIEFPTEELNELHKLHPYVLKTQYTRISTGNEGVPTDRQTNQQTDRQIQKEDKIHSQTDRIFHALTAIDEEKSLLRRQFRSLTKQEMLVYLTIYQFEEENLSVNYPSLALKLHLSESSIRDYILKILKKGVPLEKIKENNKKITLKIPSELKKIASIQAIASLKNI